MIKPKNFPVQLVLLAYNIYLIDTFKHFTDSIFLII
jgi:hypothetical protein